MEEVYNREQKGSRKQLTNIGRTEKGKRKGRREGKGRMLDVDTKIRKTDGKDIKKLYVLRK